MLKENFYQRYKVLFSIVGILASLISCLYPIIKDGYASFVYPHNILFEEIDSFSVCIGSLEFHNNFGMTKTISPFNTFDMQNSLEFPSNELLITLSSNNKLYVFEHFTISNWTIINRSSIPITPNMFYKKLEVKGINARIISIALDSANNLKIEYDENNNSATIDNVFLNPHEKIKLTVIFAPIDNKQPSTLNWNCHIEKLSANVKTLLKGPFLTPRISLQTSQIIQLVIVAFVMCLLHSIMLDMKGYFSYDFSFKKKMAWALSVLIHFAFAECVAYINWNYVKNSPEGYNWPWISITLVLEIISFVYALRFHTSNSIKQNDKVSLNLTKLICGYCQEEHSVNEIIKHLDIKSQKGFIEKILQPMQNQGIIECSQVNSKQITYHLSAKGKAFLQEQNHV